MTSAISMRRTPIRWPPDVFWAMGRRWFSDWVIRRSMHGCPIQIPWEIWYRTPVRLRRQLRGEITARSEESAKNLLQRGHPLISLLTRKDNETGFALSPMGVVLIWRMLHTLKPRCILEFGTGVSTRMFGVYARTQSDMGLEVPKVISIDHDKFWIETTRTHLNRLGVHQYVRLLWSPIVPDRLTNGARCYDSRTLESKISGEFVDFCLIDGPPEWIGRQGTLPLVAPFLAESATVVLDDVERVAECQGIIKWRNTFRNCLGKPRCLLTRGGLAVMDWRKQRNGN